MARLKYVPAALREARIRHGWSVGELARRTGISASTISRTEMGIGAPSLYVAMELCRVLGVSMKELTGL